MKVLGWEPKTMVKGGIKKILEFNKLNHGMIGIGAGT